MWVSVLTHTNPCPPPATGADALVPPVTAAAGDSLAELLGLNKSPTENFGDAVALADGVAVAPVFACLRARFGLGDAAGDSAATGEADGLAATWLVAFLRARFGFGDAAGDSAVAGEAAVAAGDAVTSDFLCVRCFFAGEGDSDGAGD